ncbi:MAG: glycolate oxidase subunit GlcE, partial [Gammaproteobacteria bacterium]
RFGGEVMKNVAGFDVSRLMAGALGTLGVLLEISLKVLPKPVHERTLVFELSLEQALRRMLELARQPLPVSALCFDGRELFIRLSGSERTVRSTAMKLGGETAASDDFWRDLNEQRLAFFRKDRPLWRMSVPPATPPPALSGDCFYDWGGSQRWLYSDEPAGRLFAAAEASEGHASLFKGGNRSGSVFQPESEALLHIAGNLKRAFDPYGILNPGKKYEAW